MMAAFAQTSYVNTQISNLVGGASTSGDTLGKIESLVSANSSDIALTQSTVANKSTKPSADSLSDEVLRYVGGTLVNDNTFASKNYVIAEIATAKNDIIGGAGAAYDTLLEIQNELQSNDTDISNILKQWQLRLRFRLWIQERLRFLLGVLVLGLMILLLLKSRMLTQKSHLLLEQQQQAMMI